MPRINAVSPTGTYITSADGGWSVVSGAGRDDLDQRTPFEVHRQRVQGAADLEGTGRQLAFELEKHGAAGKAQRRCRNQTGGAEVRRKQPAGMFRSGFHYGARRST